MKKIVCLFLILILFTACSSPGAEELAKKAAEIVISQATPMPTQEPFDYASAAEKAAELLTREFKVGDRIHYNNGESFQFPISGLTTGDKTEYATITEYYFEVTEINTFSENSAFEKGTDSKGNNTYYFYENKGKIVMKGNVSPTLKGKSVRCWSFVNSAVIETDGSFTLTTDMQNVSRDYTLTSPIAIFVD